VIARRSRVSNELGAAPIVLALAAFSLALLTYFS
jgi:hypothetical protein